MERKKKNFDQAPLVGGSSLLVIFAVLSLTVFAMLTISSALADKRLGDASAEHVRAYYEAEHKAEEILAGLREGVLPDGVSRIESGGGSGSSGSGNESGELYSYQVSISSSQELLVEVEIDGEDYKILRWQSAPVEEDWIPDDSLEVWDGGFGFGS